MFSKQSLFKGSPVALLFAVTLKMMDLEKLWLILAEMLDCATLIAAVFVADTVVFHAVSRTRDFWKHMNLRINIDHGNTSPVPLSDFLRFVFCAVAAVWVLLRLGSSNPVPPVAAWIVFRVVADYFGLALTPKDSVDEFLRQQGSDESKGRGLAWNYWTGFLERFCTALSTSELDFETKKLLLVPRSFQRPKYDEWEDISEVGELKFSATSDKTKDQRRDIKLNVYSVKGSANSKDHYFVPDFPMILKSLDGRNKDMGHAAREVTLRSFKREVSRLMDCAKKQNPGVEIPDIVEYDDLSPSHSLPSVLNQHFMKHMQAEEH